MTVSGAVHLLQQRLDVLRTQTSQLCTSVVEDHPQDADVVVVPQLLGDAIDDELGWIDGAVVRAGEAQDACARHDLSSTVTTLEECDALVAEATRRLVGGMAGVNTAVVLRQLAVDRPGPWRAWALDVEAAVAGLWPAVWAVQDAVRGCWQEIAARLVAEPLAFRVAVPTLNDPPSARTGRRQEHG